MVKATNVIVEIPSSREVAGMRRLAVVVVGCVLVLQCVLEWYGVAVGFDGRGRADAIRLDPSR